MLLKIIINYYTHYRPLFKTDLVCGKCPTHLVDTNMLRAKHAKNTSPKYS